jgi:hypothetical protein
MENQDSIYYKQLLELNLIEKGKNSDREGFFINQETLNRCVTEIENKEMEWRIFLEGLNVDKKVTRVMDRGTSARPYSLKAELSLKDTCKMVVFLSTFGNFIGVYYSSFENKSPKPILVYERDFTDSTLPREVYFTHSSYFPFTKNHLEKRAPILDEMTSTFPEFRLFEPSTSPKTLEKVQLGEDYLPKTDLFHLIFTGDPLAV